MGDVAEGLSEICRMLDENAVYLGRHLESIDMHLCELTRTNGIRTTSTPSKRRKHTSYRAARRGRPRRLFPPRSRRSYGRGYASE